MLLRLAELLLGLAILVWLGWLVYRGIQQDPQYWVQQHLFWLLALFPSVIGFLSASMPLGRAIGIFAASAYALLFCAAALLPETRGRELAAVA